MIFIQHIAPNLGYRYFRLYIDKVQTSLSSILALYTWDLYDGTTWRAVNMTSNTAPSPLVASMINSSADAWKLHDGNNATQAVGSNPYSSQVKSPPDWHQLDVGSGNEFLPTKIRIAWYNTGGYDLTGEDFNLKGSNDGSSWTLIKSWTGQASQTHQTPVEYTI